VRKPLLLRRDYRHHEPLSFVDVAVLPDRITYLKSKVVPDANKTERPPTGAKTGPEVIKLSGPLKMAGSAACAAEKS
jgi:hypothetical protein